MKFLGHVGYIVEYIILKTRKNKLLVVVHLASP